MKGYRSLQAIQTAIQAGELSCAKLVDHYLDQIEQQQSLNIYLEVYQEEARAKAIELDKKLQEQPEQLGRLWGMVVSIKDVICHKGHKVTAASKILGDFESLFSATAVERIEAEDVIIIGRTNCDEFAMGSSNENSAFGPVKNAEGQDTVPGGSSGGAAVSVQADTCLCALGTDTGGSVRQPAAFCGVIGVKPSYGRISRHGLIAYGSSFDQVGVLGKNMKDIALLLEIMSGPDDFDSTLSQQAVPAFSQQISHKNKPKIAYYKTAVEHDAVDEDIRKATNACIEKLKNSGHQVEALEFKYLDYIVPAYYVLTTAEASSNLSRFDGVRYGYRAAGAESLEKVYTASRTEGFGAEVKRRIMLGTFVLSAGFYDAYYTKAQKVRRLIAEETKAVLKDYDFILMPTTPSPAWKLGEKTSDPVAMYLADIFTVQANMVGIPAISIPMGKNEAGQHLGLQLMGRTFEEGPLMAFADYLLSIG